MQVGILKNITMPLCSEHTWKCHRFQFASILVERVLAKLLQILLQEWDQWACESSKCPLQVGKLRNTTVSLCSEHTYNCHYFQFELIWSKWIVDKNSANFSLQEWDQRAFESSGAAWWPRPATLCVWTSCHGEDEHCARGNASLEASPRVRDLSVQPQPAPPVRIHIEPAARPCPINGQQLLQRASLWESAGFHEAVARGLRTGFVSQDQAVEAETQFYQGVCCVAPIIVEKKKWFWPKMVM